MGRFFETADPHFIRDFVQGPNLDLIRLVNAKKQQEYDNAIEKISLLDSPVGDVNYLNGEVDRAKVAEKQKYYNDLVQGVLSKVQSDPKNWRNHLGSIQNISKELKADLLTGELADIQGSYFANQQWEKEHKDLKEKEPAKYELLKREAFRNYYNNNGDSTKSRWNQEHNYLTPTEKDFENLHKDIKDQLLAEELSSETTTPFFQKVKVLKPGEKATSEDGKTIIENHPTNGYLIKQGNSTKTLTPQRIQSYVLNRIKENPEWMQGFKQSQRIGLGRYFNEDGNLDVFNSDGTINQNNSLSGLLGSSSQQYIRNIKNELEYKEDTKLTHDKNRAETSRHNKATEALGRDKLKQDAYQFKLNYDQKDRALQAKEKENLIKLIQDKDADEDIKNEAKLKLRAIEGVDSGITTFTNEMNLDIFELAKKAKEDKKGLAGKVFAKVMGNAFSKGGFSNSQEENAITQRALTQYDYSNSSTRNEDIRNNIVREYLKKYDLIDYDSKGGDKPILTTEWHKKRYAKYKQDAINKADAIADKLIDGEDKSSWFKFDDESKSEYRRALSEETKNTIETPTQQIPYSINKELTNNFNSNADFRKTYAVIDSEGKPYIGDITSVNSASYGHPDNFDYENGVAYHAKGDKGQNLIIRPTLGNQSNYQITKFMFEKDPNGPLSKGMITEGFDKMIRHYNSLSSSVPFDNSQYYPNPNPRVKNTKTVISEDHTGKQLFTITDANGVPYRENGKIKALNEQDYLNFISQP